ncbi:MAG: hypothetical protein HXX08_04985 [Chloroflexi bacterium]|uniref:Uncharacterized protein n=1 Tax=Candidatus Chlorohelix allophototropha TaxID=3003348 RepID=A0A8T7LT57_9CHLR|nr:hypothetical protein [Chloroflexota bacterium]WJW67094.1 hypothetical protein OZ401_000345 [Chloroflexota bacterium L227-S17]
MSGEEMYRWFEAELKREIPAAAQNLAFSFEPTVTAGVSLATISRITGTGRPLLKAEVRPEGVRLSFPLAWQQALSDWLGAPPPQQYRLKSNWVNQPSIGVAAADHVPYFTSLAAKTLELLIKEIETGN